MAVAALHMPHYLKNAQALRNDNSSNTMNEDHLPGSITARVVLVGQSTEVRRNLSSS